MNERITELLEKAIDYADATYKYDPITGFQIQEWDLIRINHFAELIVKECLLCCERTISDPVPESVDTFLQGGTHCMDEIKQHFGVEEWI